MAAVTYVFASDTAPSTVLPRASPAATADANVQPVPCVLVVAMRFAGNSVNAEPSNSTSTASSPKWPPFTTT